MARGSATPSPALPLVSSRQGSPGAYFVDLYYPFGRLPVVGVSRSGSDLVDYFALEMAASSSARASQAWPLFRSPRDRVTILGNEALETHCPAPIAPDAGFICAACAQDDACPHERVARALSREHPEVRTALDPLILDARHTSFGALRFAADDPSVPRFADVRFGPTRVIRAAHVHIGASATARDPSPSLEHRTTDERCSACGTATCTSHSEACAVRSSMTLAEWLCDRPYIEKLVADGSSASALFVIDDVPAHEGMPLELRVRFPRPGSMLGSSGPRYIVSLERGGSRLVIADQCLSDECPDCTGACVHQALFRALWPH